MEKVLEENTVLTKMIEEFIEQDRLYYVISIAYLYGSSLTIKQKELIEDYIYSDVTGKRIDVFTSRVDWSDKMRASKKAIEYNLPQLAYNLIYRDSWNPVSIDFDGLKKLLIDSKKCPDLNQLEQYSIARLLKGVVPDHINNFEKYKKDIQAAGLMGEYEAEKDFFKQARRDFWIWQKEETLSKENWYLIDEEGKPLPLEEGIARIKRFVGHYNDAGLLTAEDLKRIVPAINQAFKDAYYVYKTSEEYRETFAFKHFFEDFVRFIMVIYESDVSPFITTILKTCRSHEINEFLKFKGVDYSQYEEALLNKKDDSASALYEFLKYRLNTLDNNSIERVAKEIIIRESKDQQKLWIEELFKLRISIETAENLEKFMKESNDPLTIETLLLMSDGPLPNDIYEKYFELDPEPNYRTIGLVKPSSPYFSKFIDMFCQKANAHLLSHLIRKVYESMPIFTFATAESDRQKINNTREYIMAHIDSLVDALAGHIEQDAVWPLKETIELLAKHYYPQLEDALYQIGDKNSLEFLEYGGLIGEKVKALFRDRTRSENELRLSLKKEPLDMPDEDYMGPF